MSAGNSTDSGGGGDDNDGPSPETLASLLQTCAIAVLAAVAFFLASLLMRRLSPAFFMPKYFELNGQRPPKTFAGGWAAMTYIWRCPEEVLLESFGGMDAVLYLRLCKYSGVLFAVLTCLLMPVLLPINYSGVNKDKLPGDTEYVAGLDVFSAANIEAESNKLWAPLVSVFAVTVAVLIYITRVYSSAVKLRHENVRDDLPARTVMVRKLPTRITTSADLFDYFSGIHGPGRVLSAVVVPRAGRLRGLYVQRSEMLAKWKTAAAKYDESGRRPTHRVGLCGHTVDSIHFYRQRLAELDDRLVDLQQQVEDEPRTRFGFVTFDSVATATQAAQSIYRWDQSATFVEPAPSPRDVYWHWLESAQSSLNVRAVVTTVLIVVVFVFGTVPVSLISAYTNLDQLSDVPRLGSFVSWLQQYRAIYGTISNFLASLALLIFMSILPYLLRAILRHRGFHLHTLIDSFLTTTFWMSLVFNVFLVTTISGSVYSQLPRLSTYVESPRTIVLLLATSLPAQASFFVNYIVVQTCIMYPLLFSRMVDFVLCKLKQWLFCRTNLDRLKCLVPDPFDFTMFYARECLIFCIALTYSTMSPLVLPFATLHFCVTFFLAKHNFVYVHTPFYEGLRITPSIVTKLTVGLIIYQLTTAGLLGLKQFYISSIIFILPVITLIYRFWWLEDRFGKGLMYVGLESCPKTTRTPMDGDVRDCFTDPAMRTPVVAEKSLQEEYSYDESAEFYPPLLPLVASTVAGAPPLSSSSLAPPLPPPPLASPGAASASFAAASASVASVASVAPPVAAVTVHHPPPPPYPAPTADVGAATAAAAASSAVTFAAAPTFIVSRASTGDGSESESGEPPSQADMAQLGESRLLLNEQKVKKKRLKIDRLKHKSFQVSGLILL